MEWRRLRESNPRFEGMTPSRSTAEPNRLTFFAFRIEAYADSIFKVSAPERLLNLYRYDHVSRGICISPHLTTVRGFL